MCVCVCLGLRRLVRRLAHTSMRFYNCVYAIVRVCVCEFRFGFGWHILDTLARMGTHNTTRNRKYQANLQRSRRVVKLTRARFDEYINAECTLAQRPHTHAMHTTTPNTYKFCARRRRRACASVRMCVCVRARVENNSFNMTSFHN